MKYRLDVIVPTHGHLEQTIRCLKALYRNTVVPFHLIVVDDSTPDMDDGTDLTPTWIWRLAGSHENITYARSEESYKSHSEIINKGLELCETQYVALISNSLAVDPAWDVMGLKTMMSDSQIGIVGFKVLDASTGLIESAGIRKGINGSMLSDIGNRETADKYTEIYECDAVEFAFVMFRKEAVLGIFDETLYHGFMGMEDLDTCFVVKEKGWKVFYCGRGKGYHNVCATRGSSDIGPLIKNMENKEIFAKRWGYWEDYHQFNPGVEEFLPALEGVKR